MKSENIYKISEGSRNVPKGKAQEIGEYLEGLAAKRKGQITPIDVVNAARKEDSLLHGYFEWDDSSAGDQYRLDQARYLLRVVEVEVTYKDNVQTERMFLNVKTNGSRAYVSTQIVAENIDYKSQVVEQALKELVSWKAKYKRYQELDLVFGAIEETQKSLNLNS